MASLKHIFTALLVVAAAVGCRPKTQTATTTPHTPNCPEYPCVLARGQNNPKYIALDGASVFWTNSVSDGSVMRVPDLGGVPPFTVAEGIRTPLAVAVDANKIYFSSQEDGTLAAVAIEGGDVATLANGLSQVQGIAIDVRNAYAISTKENGLLTSVPLAGGTVTTLADEQATPSAIALDDGRIYWGTQSDGKIHSTARDRTTVSDTTLATVATKVTALAVDSDNIYWTGADEGAVIAYVPKGGGSIVTLSPRLGLAPQRLAVDDEFVYWTETGSTTTGGQVLKIPKTGAPSPTVLATGQDTPFDIAVDATYVYWSNAASDGSIVKTTKTP